MAKSEPELAAKVPENDAVAEATSTITSSSTANAATGKAATAFGVFPNNTPAQGGASMGEHCVTDRPTPTGAASTGEISKIADIEVYITRPGDYPHSPSKLLILLSSGTGIHSTNNQIQADMFAKEGFLVVMPDQFGGDPAPNSSDPNTVPEASSSVIEQVKLRAVETVQSFMLDMWLARQTPEKVMPILQKIVEGAKKEFADAVANGGGLYAVGYCFGAKYVLLLGGELPDSVAQRQSPTDVERGVVKKAPLIKAGAIAHGTLITKQDLEGLQAPVAMICVENDQLFPEEILEAGRKHLKANQIKHKIDVYPNLPHGFAVVGEYEDWTIQAAQKAAFKQMVEWLKAH